MSGQCWLKRGDCQDSVGSLMDDYQESVGSLKGDCDDSVGS